MYGYLGLFEAAFYPVTLGMLSELIELGELGTQKPSGKNLAVFVSMTKIQCQCNTNIEKHHLDGTNGSQNPKKSSDCP